MVVLTAAITTRSGKPILARQFRQMQRSRVEALLASFPKLADTASQHTTVEQDNVRFVYQPLDELYMVLITNRQSNILQDISTLHLFAQVVASICKSMDEREISRNAFELLSAFDEVVTQGYRENLTMSQIKTFLDMESHEERIQEIISRNKELEASEERKRKAKQLEMQRKEISRNARAGGSGAGGMGSRQPSYPTYTAPTPAAPSMTDSYDSYNAAKNPSFNKPLASRGKGMQLGKKKPGNSMFDQVRGDLGPEAEASAPLAGVPTPAAPVQPSIPATRGSLDREGIHVTVAESITARFSREGTIEAFEVKGDLQLRITDASLTQVKLDLAVGDTKGAQLNAHPKVDKAEFKNNNTIQLTDTSKGFPANNSIQVMRWRLNAKPDDVQDPPIKFTVWLSESSTDTYSVTVEYELTGDDPLKDVTVVIPYSTSEPSVSSFDAVYEVSGDSIDWTIGDVDESNPSGSFEFEAQASGEGDFFPMQVRFSKSRPWVDIDVGSVSLLNMNQDVGFSKDIRSVAENYQIGADDDAPSLHVLATKRLSEPIKFPFTAYSHIHDLLAVVTNASEVQVFRIISGQIAFNVKRGAENAAEVTAVAWRGDGERLGVGWSDGTYEIYDGGTGRSVQMTTVADPNGDALEDWRLYAEAPPKDRFGRAVLPPKVTRKVHGKVESFGWMAHQVGSKKTNDVLTDDWEGGFDLDGLEAYGTSRENESTALTALTALPRAIAGLDVTKVLPRLSAIPSAGIDSWKIAPEGPKFVTQAATDSAFDTQKEATTNLVESLTVAQEDGTVQVLLDDTVKIGSLFIGGRPVMHAAHPQSPSHIYVTETEDMGLQLSFVDLPLSTFDSATLHVIASNTKRIQSYIDYVVFTLRCIENDYTTGTSTLAKVIALLPEELATSKDNTDVVFNFYHLALTGVFSAGLLEWMKEIVRDQNMKRWEPSISTMYTNLTDHLFVNLLPALDRFSIAVTTLRGYARLHDGSSKFDVSPLVFDIILENIDSLRLVAQRMLLIATTEHRQFRAWFKWFKLQYEVASSGPFSQSALETEQREMAGLDYSLILAYIKETFVESKLAMHILDRPELDPIFNMEKFKSNPVYRDMGYERTKEAMGKLQALRDGESLAMKDVHDPLALLNIPTLAAALVGNVRAALDRITDWQSRMLVKPTTIPLELPSGSVIADMTHFPTPQSPSGDYDAQHDPSTTTLVLSTDPKSPSILDVLTLTRQPNTSTSSPSPSRHSGHPANPAIIKTQHPFPSGTILSATFLPQPNPANIFITLFKTRDPKDHVHLVRHQFTLSEKTGGETQLLSETIHVFAPPEESKFRPERMLVGGRKGKEVCVVFGKGGREWRVLDLAGGQHARFGKAVDEDDEWRMVE
ncbi:unnamed protein product [Zymoseptoria tritici ST99CH_3D1]|nr:unnamed protein product [Zymoseptoria tritici ST99CH_3D1]